MIANTLAPNIWKIMRSCVAVLCSALLVPGDAMVLVPGDALLAVHAQEKAAGSGEQQAPKIPADQLDSLVAPIALYPDPMLAQVLAASTYPLELVQLQQWLGKNKNLKDKALADAVAKQPWDPSVQAMAGLPDVVKRLADDVQWTTELGNAFLAQQDDVMEAVQRMRKKAQGTGNLKSNEQQKVETKVVESKQVIVIEQANPQVVYVPSYQPTVVYGAPAYPYPPISYPPPGYYAAGMAISFGVGVAVGAAMGGGWGWGCGWGGHNDITINTNNNFNRNTNVSGGNRVSTRGGAGGSSWQHNPQHRGGTPYGNQATAQKFGGTARGSSATNRQAGTRQNVGQQGNRQQAGTRDTSSRGQQAGTRDTSSRGQQPSAGNRASSGADRGGGGGGGGDRVGNRSVSPSSSSRSGGGGGAFGGGSGSMSGGSARASSSRGSASMGGRGGGGGRRGR